MTMALPGKRLERGAARPDRGHEKRSGGTGLLLVVLALLLPLAGCGASATGSGTASAAAKTLVKDGGTKLVLQASCLPDQLGCDLAKSANVTTVLEHRAEALGVAGAVARADSAGQITVELPGMTDDARVKQVLTTVGRVDILDTGGMPLYVGSSVAGKTCGDSCQPGQYRIIFTSAQMDPASISATTDRQTGQPVVTFAFAGSAQKAFADYTRNNIGRYLTITLDDMVIESATIQSEIDSMGQVIGIASSTEAQNLAIYMTYGPLPVALRVVSDERVSAATPTQSAG